MKYSETKMKEDKTRINSRKSEQNKQESCISLINVRHFDV